jgi:thiamine pyrophosphate-dependent acetolactate synthase large subunit-like protein
MLLCLHEEVAIAIAHGYAKTSGRMMGAVVHSNVGLMHATMAVFNAWCDRAPVLMLGATGPWDAARRRPWIDWIHTSSDQGGLIRNFTKWDNQPGSPAAAQEALLRATQIAQTAPRGPVYINLEVKMQEQKLGAMPPLPDVSRYPVPPMVMPKSIQPEHNMFCANSAHNFLHSGRINRNVGTAANPPAIIITCIPGSSMRW